MQEVHLPEELAALPWPDVPGGATVLIPAGSTEQHGPHLPLDTDTVIAAAVARGVAAELGGQKRQGRVVVAPALPYGASGEHQQFPGTVSLGTDALQSVVIELVRSLSTWAGRIIFVNAHGGNTTALARAVTRLTGEGHTVSWVPCLAGAVDAHAGRTETSLMLHLVPESVDTGRAVRGNTAALADLMPAMAAGGVAAVSASGILGNPEGASAAEGADLLHGAVASVLARMAGAADRHGCLQSAGAAI
ncbi:mycofactocin biosynthesis peptidyl-dipeptidase MftE [Arthrobacter sp. zg-Y820]|uniref:mycofactocin biosynthesis peptidyl-dipeptidase MftE n=1 Tax=unclassified Arthrobacter TaxID=235627 RepID=UPI001E338838|nr:MULTISPECIES: mycofactocin biosynthesis peptidyl-dipeptidase MftE [unclassified Arthrobacter]MCC9196873.1 mycofactocin biosynthesis peptidyl-dipeptidase MftE [Arthrobacter sp. zg-Y820]MDK1279737.1 mycofactocin biosynthesis peptidyl-dipeptidase MftE [Arthrobacter sp. zg.Y820]WIB11006.1 mycofactocin biosynthesis peptidyl-dipeptidase MftE [Arthrobacter sp. zg-Y820]